MSASQAANFNLQEFSDGGALLSGGRIYTYAYGTTTFKTAYTDQAATIPHTYTLAEDGISQYIALNSRGELPAPLYLTSGAYDIALKTAANVTIWTRRADPLDGVLVVNATNSANVAITDDVATNATMYPVWGTTNTGNLPMKVTSTKLTFNPSSGVLSATSFSGAGTGLTGTAASLTAGTATNQSGGTVAATTGTFSTSALVTGTGGFGYNIGAGGSVTQITSISTAVTLNKPTGIINCVTGSALVGAGASAVFDLTNSVIAANDMVLVEFDVVKTQNVNVYALPNNGYASIVIENNSAAAWPVASATPHIRFLVIKSVNS